MERERPPHVGHATLNLLIEEWSVPILRALMVGPRRPSELEDRLPTIPHSALMRRLGELGELDLADRHRERGLNPLTRYTLTPSGRMILDVASAAERWERRWSETQHEGMDGLRLIADEHTRELLLALAPAPARPRDLEHAVAITRSPLRSRLGQLAALGVLKRTGGTNHATYSITASARDLMLVAIAAGRWEWTSQHPQHHPLAINVARTLHMFGPCIEVPADVKGICTLHVDDGNNGPTVVLAVDGRSVTNLTSADPVEARATCRGSPRAWCHGLLARNWEGVRSTGNRALMAAILASLTVVVS